MRGFFLFFLIYFFLNNILIKLFIYLSFVLNYTRLSRLSFENSKLLNNFIFKPFKIVMEVVEHDEWNHVSMGVYFYVHNRVPVLFGNAQGG